MMDAGLDPSEQRRALSIAVGELLAEHAECLGDGRMTIPVIDDWVCIVATGDAADGTTGGIVKMHPVNQWSHRSAGLIQSAADDYRHVVVPDEDD